MRLPWRAADYESTRELMHRMDPFAMRAALIHQHATDERAREIAERLSQMVEEESREDDGGEGGALVPVG
jgi:hypothetical protein